jgi:ATP-dependent helicase/nuclease subunit A
MAAVTFTRKAAAELRGRFQLALEGRLAKAPAPDERARLEAALAGIERLFAGTIHAFCAHLLRERPVDAGVAPGFGELGEAEETALRKQAWRDYVAEKGAGGFKPMLDLLEAGVPPRQLDKAFAVVCEHDDVAFDEGDGQRPEPSPVWKAIDGFWNALSALRTHDFSDKTKCQVQQRFDDLAGRLAVARRERAASLAGFLREWRRAKFTAKWWGPDGGFDEQHKKKAKALVEAFDADVVEPFLGEFEAYVHHLAMLVLNDARSFYAGLRRRRNAVNYVDLLGITARTLRACPDVRRALRDKYRFLFIDEFQDTDPIQAEIFLLLAAEEGGATPAEAGDAFALPLRPGALFVVGDPKQSIFRFRRADIDIYNRVAERIVQSGGRRLQLTANFRSRPGVCAVANTIFPALFAQHAPPYSPAFQALDPVRTDDSPEPAVATLTSESGEHYVELEADAIARYVASEVTAGRRAYGDFLVLTRFKGRLATIAGTFDRYDIPVEVSGGGYFLQSPDVRAIALLLTALADPLDSVSLLGVLRGPLFGLSDPELFMFKQAGGRFELNVPLPEADGAQADAALRKTWGPALDAMRRLRAMQAFTRSLPAGAAVDRILEETGWLALAGTMAGGAGAGHLLQAVDRVRQVIEEGGGLAAGAEALLEDDSSESEALPLEPGKRNVVRLMNLHKAKGLEAPATFLADAEGDYNFPANLRVVRRGRGAVGHLRIEAEGARKFTRIKIGQPRDWAAHEEEEKKYRAAERLRLMYVAGTRAKDLLVVCRSSKPSDNKAWDVFAPSLSGVPELRVPKLKPAEPAGSRLSAAGRAAAAKARERAFDVLTSPSWHVASVTERHAGGKPAVAADEGGVADADEAQAAHAESAIAAAGVERRIDAGPAFGTLVHDLLEYATRHRDTGRPDLERLARWLTLDVPDVIAAIPSALDTAARVMAQPFWADAKGGAETQAEVPFSILIPAGTRFGGLEPSAAATVLRGVIDLVYRASDGWRIVDYKTDAFLAPGETLRDRHAPQLARYAAAWERATGDAVTAKGLVSARTGQVEWE